MNIIKLRLCHNDTVLIFVIRTRIQTRIQTPMSKGVQMIEVPLYLFISLLNLCINSSVFLLFNTWTCR